ncbi:FAD-dependent oxidoreductase [Patulibacter sp. NPDC049589]|uniref:FAD-dependent oxidoreductase n=1 Tax=Patulibacter sp. NPDC049589 TaxID=3154731 RepID=UPI003421AC02
MEFDHTTDVLIVGSGAAGLVSALVAHDRGLRPLVVEKSDKIGGASAYSGGGLWIPNNDVIAAAGVKDSREEARTYMDDVIGDVGPASSPERRAAFLDHGPEMVRFLARQGFRWVAGLRYSDYYPDRPGGKAEGRGIEGEMFDVRRLGDWQEHLLLNPMTPPLPMYTNEVGSFALAAKTRKGFRTAARVIGRRFIGGRLQGKVNMTNGRSLIGQLMLLNKDRGTQIWRQSPFVDLIVEDGAVVGALVDHEGRRLRVRAERGVLLSAGGFARNLQMRQEHERGPISTEWTSVPPGDTGDAIQAGVRAGAATALMDDAWWGPTLVDPATGTPAFILWERSFPHSIIVDTTGRRFMNESASYIDTGHAMYERNEELGEDGRSIPAWLIVDARHRNRYPMATLLPGITPKSAIASGFLTRGETLDELARKIGVDPAGLSETVGRFNAMALRGVDDDFDRGRTAYDRFYGDPTVSPNPNLGTLEKAPFWAVRVWPGDLGTKGGLLTDERARVVREDGTPIPGLYGAGNTTASVMGRTYPGPGATLGPATTFAYIATHDMADAASRPAELAAAPTAALEAGGTAPARRATVARKAAASGAGAAEAGGD